MTPLCDTLAITVKRHVVPADWEESLRRRIEFEVSLMKVHRIVANIQTADIAIAEVFYHDVLGLKLVMDQGWIRTYGSSEKMTVQVSFATQGGSGTPVPDLSIEVDDIEVALRRVRKARLSVEYGPKSEPWGVRRFYVRDPVGKLVNVMQHL
jgi:catechol 2,3-dioxygenase-like lactoylglutathione lyase family enzyme